MNPQNSAAPHSAGKNVPMGVLAYLGPLVLIPLLTSKDDLFVKFHIKQGLVLLTIEVIVWFLSMVTWQLWILLKIVNLVVFILAIIGIVNVVKGREKKLPLVGKFAHNFKI